MENLTHLSYLDLPSDNLTCQVPSFQHCMNLTHIDLSRNGLSGMIHSAHFPDLKNLLSNNDFDGTLSNFSDPLPSSLDTLDLSSNRSQGGIPGSFFELRKLSIMLLSSINLSGLLRTVQFQDRLGNLTTLDLSFNNLMIITSDNLTLESRLPKFSSLKLASCNLKKFLNLRNQTRLITFDLSHNKIEGEIPKWIWEVVGRILFPPQTATVVDYSENRFDSPLPVLELSNNHLTGVIPPCLLGFTSNLGELNLGNNSLSGQIEGMLPSTRGLNTLDLQGNSLEGKIPESLVNCVMLENYWSKLQILDIALNYFSGVVPANYFLQWGAMMTDERSSKKHLSFTVLQLSDFYYQDKVAVTVKGLELELVKILTIFNSIDVSSNRYQKFNGRSGSLVGQGSAITDWVWFRPMTAKLGPEAQVIVSPKPEGLVSISLHSNSPMANFSAKYSIITQEMVDSFCESFYISAEVHPTAPGRDKTIAQFPADMGLLDFIKTADLQKVRALEVQKGDDQVTLLESTRHCFMPLVIPAAGGSGSVAATEIPAPTEKGQESVAEENAYLELADPDKGTAMARQSDEEVVAEQPKKIKKKRLTKQSDVLPAKRLRTDHPSLAFDTEDTVAATTTSTKAKFAADVNPDLAGPSQLEESEGSDDSFYELATLDPAEAKRWYVPRWNITNDSLLDDGFSCRTLMDRVAPLTFFSALRSMDCDQLYTEFNVGAVRQICLGSEVRSRAKHELELKEKLNAKYAARGKLLEKKDSEILRLKSQLAEKEAETAEVVRLRDQVSSLSGEKSALTAEVSALKVVITQKDHDISLVNSRATHLESALNDAQVACTEAGTKITSLSSERDRLVSEVSSLLAGFKDFKERMKVQQEEQAQELYNRVAELEAYVMDVSGRLEGEFYPTHLTLLAGKRWLLTHGIQLALLKCLKSSEYQGILGHTLGQAIDFGMQEGLEAGHEHGVAGRSLSAVDAYNPEVASAEYVNAVRAPEDAHFPLVHLFKSKKDVGIEEVLDCFLLDGPFAELSKAASLQPCIE
ncbi:receptor-like protein 7 [Tanacetum coccineum]|uniref:Receptor-like protein 7 n=1 Tax=Tanacetum coccineum TaxID=301880 RepID=A0ABQ5EEY6_9ASTR